MQFLLVLAALMGVLFSVRAAAVLPVEDRSPIHANRVRRVIFIVHMFILICNVLFSTAIDRFVHSFVGKM